MKRSLNGLCGLIIIGALCGPAGAYAVMAGAPPDTPALRVDANTVSSPYAGVGSLIANGGTFTAVAVGRRHVLTAAHVVQNAVPTSIVFNLNFGGNLTHQIPVAAVHLHPGFVSFNNPNLNDDIAVVELASELPTGVPVYALNTTSLAAGTVLVVVGYGGSGNGSSGTTITSSPSVKRVGRNSADSFIVDDEGSGQNEVFLFDFDGGSAANVMGGQTLGNSLETTFAGGDSGSPSFVETGGGLLLAGVNTFVGAGSSSSPGTFGTIGGGVLVAAYAAWIGAIVASPSPSAADAEIPTLGEWGALVLAAVLLGLALRQRRAAS